MPVKARAASRISRLARLAPTGLAAALLVAVAVTSLAAASSPPAHAAAVAVTIKTSERIHDFTRTVTISGRVASHQSGVQVTLNASAFPFAAPVAVAQGSTDAGGSYRFKVKPLLNTRYTVALTGTPTVQSSTLTVYVVPHAVQKSCNLCAAKRLTAGSSYTLRIVFTLRVPPGTFAVVSTERHYFYYGQRTGSRPPTRLRLVGTFVGTPISADTISVTTTHTIRIPKRGSFVFRSQSCAKDMASLDGLGLPGHHHCGDASVSRRQAFTYLG